MENLAFSYSGNRRTGYWYDANGNITYDRTNDLEISYNFLNLVSQVKDGTTDAIRAEYQWLADGTKLSAVNAAGNGYDYVGSFIYGKSGGISTLESAPFSGGRIVKTSSGYEVNYFITDHLGSTRVVFSQNLTDLGRNDYYPFGLKTNSHHLPTGTNRWLYNGKESQAFLWLNYLDYGARFYDPQIGSWLTIDPLAEKRPWESPYSFAGNNPIRYVDPDGRFYGPGGPPVASYTDYNYTTTEHLQKAGAIGLSFTPIGDIFSLITGTDMSGGESSRAWAGVSTALSIIPFGKIVDAAGDLIRGGVQAAKAVDKAVDAADAVGDAGRAANVGRAAAKESGQGFNSFTAFKRAMGPAGEGQAWHHIVEQTLGNVAKFGNETIHNTGNLMKLPHGTGSVHNMITGHYNSLIPGSNQTVRQWLSTQSFDDQYQYGIKILQQHGIMP